MGGIYQFAEPVDTKSVFTYAPAMQQCVDRHPQLSMTVAKADTDAPYFAFCPRLDLNQHIRFLENGEESEIKTIERVLPSILDAPLLPSSIPFWQIVVLPFSQTRCFIAFSSSHALGDAISSLAFHGTFLEALQEQSMEKDLICTPTRKQLSPAYDTAKNLPISWSFLLAPLLGHYLPKSLAAILGVRASVASVTPGTWTARPYFYTPETYRTGVRIISIDAATVDKTLKLCRENGAKMTGLLHQLVIAALSETLPQPHNIDNFTSQTAMDMRGAFGVSKDEMGLFVSGYLMKQALQETSPESKGEFSWAVARSMTERLAKASRNVQDHSVGLLRYVSDIRAWTLEKPGKRRDGSYEISNLVSFRPRGPVKRCSATEMVFCQPTDVSASALVFNVVSAAGGPMNIAVGWQVGALDLGSYDDEVKFVNAVCESIERDFARLCQ